MQQMVAVACGAAWAGLPGDLAALAAPWALTWSQVRIFSTCTRYLLRKQSKLLLVLPGNTSLQQICQAHCVGHLQGCRCVAWGQSPPRR